YTTLFRSTEVTPLSQVFVVKRMRAQVAEERVSCRAPINSRRYNFNVSDDGASRSIRRRQAVNVSSGSLRQDFFSSGQRAMGEPLRSLRIFNAAASCCSVAVKSLPSGKGSR